MKKVFSGIVSTFLALVVLTAGNLYTISKMECLRSGTSRVIIGIPETCCNSSQDNCCEMHEKCCMISTSCFQITTILSLEKKKLPAPDSQTLFYTWHATHHQDNASTDSSPSTAALLYKPPLTGKSILLKFSTLII